MLAAAGTNPCPPTCLPACHPLPCPQRFVHVGLVPAVYRYQALAKALRRSHDAEDDDVPLEEQA